MERQKILSIDIGVRNLGMTVVEYHGMPPFADWKDLSITQLELIDIVDECQKGKKQRNGSKPKNAKTINIHLLCNALVQILLDRTSWLEGVTSIRVEQQPLMRGRSTGSVGSSRMKVIQHCILTFYETFYCMSPSLLKPIIQPSSPANKLKCVIDMTNFATEPLEKTDKSTDYKQRKAKAVEGFGKIIEKCTISDVHRHLYTDRKKHDDLADCILQAVYEIQVHVCKVKNKQEKNTTHPKVKRAKKDDANTNQST
jgi:hypothetical protein